MDPEDPVTPDSFKSKSIPKRMLVILAGSLMNFLLPIILFSGIFFIQGMDWLVNEPVLGNVMLGMAADKAGLREGDKILSINGKPMQDWKEIVVTLRANGTKEVAIEAERQGVVKTYTMQPEYDSEARRALIGSTPKFEKVEMSFAASIKEGVSYTKFIIISMVDGLTLIITG